MKRKQIATFVAMLVVAPVVLQAAVITLYDGATGNIVTDTAAFNVTTDLGNGTTYGVENVSAPTPFGTGNAMRMYDNIATDKPELRGELGTAITGEFRIDFQSFNQSTNSTTKAIRFRMGNTGASVTSEDQAAFSVSWQADGDIGGKYSGAADGNLLDVDTKNSSPLTGVQNVTMIGNANAVGTYAYTLFGETRVLDAQHYDLYIGGVLLNNSGDADFANGMEFTLGKSAANYVPANGLQSFGLFGSGSSDVDPDVQFDNIILRTGTDVIPEPATLGLLGLSGLILVMGRRFRIRH